MQKQINESWNRIEYWLKENCNELYNCLGNGLTESCINEIETKINRKLPDDYKYSLKRHDGVIDFKLLLTDGRDSFELLRKERIFEALDLLHRRDSEIHDEFCGGGIKQNVIDLLPIGYFSSGDYLYLDLFDGIVKFISHDGDYKKMDSFGCLLKTNAENLEKGNYGICYNILKTPMVTNLK